MATKDERYNGWTNYETWFVALWIDNDEGTHERRHEMAREALDHAEPNALLPEMDTARYGYEQALEDWVEEMCDAPENGLAADLLTAALGRVDWREIAQNWIEEERAVRAAEGGVSS